MPFSRKIFASNLRLLMGLLLTLSSRINSVSETHALAIQPKPPAAPYGTRHSRPLARRPSSHLVTSSLMRVLRTRVFALPCAKAALR